MRDGASSGPDLLDGFRQGNLDAFESLFRLHQRTVYGWVLRILRDPSAAEDVTLEAFWRIHRAHARFDPSRSFEAWARTIATHAALDWMRAHKNDRGLMLDCLDQMPGHGNPDPVLSAEIRQKTARAFHHLPPKLRIPTVLAVVEERPHKEIAEALGISVAAVKLRVFRALRLLRKDLQQQGVEP